MSDGVSDQRGQCPAAPCQRKTALCVCVSTSSLENGEKGGAGIKGDTVTHTVDGKGTEGEREGLRVTHHHTCAHIGPPPSLQPTPPTELRACSRRVYAHTHI